MRLLVRRTSGDTSLEAELSPGGRKKKCPTKSKSGELLHFLSHIALGLPAPCHPSISLNMAESLVEESRAASGNQRPKSEFTCWCGVCVLLANIAS